AQADIQNNQNDKFESAGNTDSFAAAPVNTKADVSGASTPPAPKRERQRAPNDPRNRIKADAGSQASPFTPNQETQGSSNQADKQDNPGSN
ncbi:MAG: hypothetical protein P8J44_04395, partial [Gammaproteobacteria bacterium]|nr:hypothetical protein [Gammaproteobacteria bacterium]